MQIPMRLSLFLVLNAKLAPTTWNDFIPAFSFNHAAEVHALRRACYVIVGDFVGEVYRERRRGELPIGNSSVCAG